MSGSKISSTDQTYFEWLYSFIGSVTDRNPNHSYWLLAEQLHKKEFRYLVPNDDNRAVDGKALRHVYASTDSFMSVDVDESAPCSMLELCIGLAIRMNFAYWWPEQDTVVGDWFWELMKNVGLDIYTDDRYSNTEKAWVIIEEVLDVVIDRSYTSQGYGGLFPLWHTDGDQNELELWSQMSRYLEEKERNPA